MTGIRALAVVLLAAIGAALLTAMAIAIWLSTVMPIDAAELMR